MNRLNFPRLATFAGCGALTLATLLGPGSSLSLAQPPAKPVEHPQFDSLDAVNAYYMRRMNEMDHWHIKALAEQAVKLQGTAANVAYRQLFNLAIARDFYADAEPAAESIITGQVTNLDLDVQALAHLVNVIAEADRGAYDSSLQQLESYVIKRKQEGRIKPLLPPDLTITIADAYLQRLLKAGRFDVAEKFIALTDSAPSPEVRQHFAVVGQRLKTLGKPAPALECKDVDGEVVSLAALKGKVVLVLFWATWCTPSYSEIAQFNAFYEENHDKGFEVIGINVDGLHEKAHSAAEIKALVRRAIVDNNISWPNILCSTEDNHSKDFGVQVVPANFLIGRDGKVVAFDLHAGDFKNTVNKAIQAK